VAAGFVRRQSRSLAAGQAFTGSTSPALRCLRKHRLLCSNRQKGWLQMTQGALMMQRQTMFGLLDQNSHSKLSLTGKKQRDTLTKQQQQAVIPVSVKQCSSTVHSACRTPVAAHLRRPYPTKEIAPCMSSNHNPQHPPLPPPSTPTHAAPPATNRANSLVATHTSSAVIPTAAAVASRRTAFRIWE